MNNGCLDNIGERRKKDLFCLISQCISSRDMLEKILHNLHLFEENNFFFFFLIIRRSDLSRWICLPQTANWPQETTQGVKLKEQ